MFCKAIITSPAVAGMLPAALATSCNSKFHWGSCDFKELNPTVKYECSNFTVPLDYLDIQSNKTLTLQLTRVPATNGESQGSIFFNFGGPGLEVRKTLVTQAEQLLTITEGKFDLIGWDPRYVSDYERSLSATNSTPAALPTPCLSSATTIPSGR